MVFTISWLSLALFFLLLELSSPGFFYFLSFFIGCLLAAFVELQGLEPLVQVYSFMAATLISLLILHWWFRRSGVSNRRVATNVDALIGKEGVLLEPIIDQTPGRVKLFGDVWLARSVHGKGIAKGTKVMVVRVTGNHLVVDESSK